MPSPASRSLSLARVAIPLAAGAFVLWSALFIRESSFISADGARRYCLLDDAMVSMRYAWNLSHGNGLVWNPGERVEGITNLLMTLLMAPLTTTLAKSAAVLAVQVLGAVFVLLTALFSWKVALRIAEESGVNPPWLSPLVFACTLAYYPLAFWSLLGMETGLLATLVTGAVLVAARSDGIPRPSAALAILLGLSLLTRPDAVIFIVVIMAYRVAGLWSTLRSPERGSAIRSLGAETALIGAVAVGLSAFRLLYYGRLTPNTYLLKLGGFELRDRIPNGLGFIGPYLESTGVFIGLALLFAVLDESRLKLCIVGLVVAISTYQVWVGGDLGGVWRLMSPVMPVFVGLVVVEIVTLIERRARGARLEAMLAPRPRLWSRLKAGVVVILALATMIRINTGYIDDILLRKTGYLFDMADANRGNVDVALALKDLALPGATVGVSWAGAIPYYSGLGGVDFLGKCDPHIASLAPDVSGKISGAGMKSVPGHNKYDLTYSIEVRQPTYIQEYRWGRQNLRRWVAEHYVSLIHRGALLCLQENSPYIDWRRASSNRRHGCDEAATKTLWRDAPDERPTAPHRKARPPIKAKRNGREAR